MPGVGVFSDTAHGEFFHLAGARILAFSTSTILHAKILHLDYAAVAKLKTLPFSAYSGGRDVERGARLTKLIRALTFLTISDSQFTTPPPSAGTIRGIPALDIVPIGRALASQSDYDGTRTTGLVGKAGLFDKSLLPAPLRSVTTVFAQGTDIKTIVEFDAAGNSLTTANIFKESNATNLIAEKFTAAAGATKIRERIVNTLDQETRNSITAFADTLITLGDAQKFPRVLLWTRVSTNQEYRNMNATVLADLIAIANAAHLQPILMGDRLEVNTGGCVEMRRIADLDLFKGENSYQRQLFLLQHLMTRKRVVGQAGVKSGFMDGAALMGLPTLLFEHIDDTNSRMHAWAHPKIPGYIILPTVMFCGKNAPAPERVLFQNGLIDEKEACQEVFGIFNKLAANTQAPYRNGRLQKFVSRARDNKLKVQFN